ncbi:hypothetical protein LXL04_033149 [Taraxacum kok-saghyz]
MWNFAAKFLNVVLLLFFIFPTLATAEIKSFKIRNDASDLILIDEFEFTNTGHVSVAISGVSVTSIPESPPDPSRIGFFLVSDDALSYLKRPSCDLDFKFISLLFTFQNLSGQSSFNTSYDVTYPNLYSLIFANCNPLSHVTMDIRTEFYNTHNNGTIKDYLSAGQSNLPSLYIKFSLIYLSSIAVWIFVCIINHRQYHRIHLLMGVLLLMKGLNLLLAAKVQHSIKVTGVPVHGWIIFLYILQFFTTMYFYTVVAFIIGGCCFLGDLVMPGMMFGLILVTPLQIFATIAYKLSREVLLESLSWDFGFVCADNLCHVVFIGFLMSVWCTSPEIVNNHLAKVTLLRMFHIVFIVYSVVDLVCKVVGSDWAKVAEIANLVLYIVMFMMFRPSQKNDFFAPIDRS